MKAVISDQPGPPETLRYGDMPEPVAGPGQVRVAMKAASLNFPDLLTIEDKYQRRAPRPFAPGFEGAGFVDQVGEGVTQFKVGDRVLTHGYWGALAEKLVAVEGDVVAIPDFLPFDDAAALPLTYFTAHYALTRRGALRAGETVLVLGAAGGVGLASVQLAKALGARVVAAVSSEEKAARARANGADETLIYPTGDAIDARALAASFKAAVGEDGADIIVDVLGGAYSEPALRAIAWYGRHLIIGFAAGMTAMPLNLILLKSCQVIGVLWGGWARRFTDESGPDKQAVFELYRQGLIRPEITERYPLADGSTALMRLADRKAAGKIVVLID
jgi:NADPH2:quinone reductase